jgi:hypothetical protein
MIQAIVYRRRLTHWSREVSILVRTLDLAKPIGLRAVRMMLEPVNAVVESNNRIFLLIKTKRRRIVAVPWWIAEEVKLVPGCGGTFVPERSPPSLGSEVTNASRFSKLCCRYRWFR